MEKLFEGDGAEKEGGAKPAEEVEQTKVADIEKASQTESSPTIIMTVGDGSTQPGHNMVAMDVAMVSAPTVGQQSLSPRTAIKIKYPQGWKKEKHFREGDIKEVAPEIADQFVALGIASIVEQPTE